MCVCVRDRVCGWAGRGWTYWETTRGRGRMRGREEQEGGVGEMAGGARGSERKHGSEGERNWGGTDEGSPLHSFSVPFDTRDLSHTTHRRKGDRRVEGKHGTEGEHEQAHGCTSSQPASCPHPPPLALALARARAGPRLSSSAVRHGPSDGLAAGRSGFGPGPIRQGRAHRHVCGRPGRAGWSRRQAIRRGSGGEKDGRREGGW